MALPPFELEAFRTRQKELTFTLLGDDGLPLDITGYTLTWRMGTAVDGSAPLLEFDTADPEFVIQTQSGATLGQAILTLSTTHLTQNARTYYWEMFYTDGSLITELYPPSPFILREIV